MGFMDKVKEMFSGGTGEASDAADKVEETAGDAADNVEETAGDAADKVEETAGDAADKGDGSDETPDAS